VTTKYHNLRSVTGSHKGNLAFDLSNLGEKRFTGQACLLTSLEPCDETSHFPLTYCSSAFAPGGAQ